ncbi:uncharacterized protein A4U43_C10F14480 [Asparagus officinalis]|uniref:Uncharacterized protein n=1 Tax=Asparagus officinalis TaxID=4686 RepID=A0A5P1E2R6_ASPOF|nr:uncharacterized protein A4U43_C10F14480 [Asparagus officinalis]
MEKEVAPVKPVESAHPHGKEPAAEEASPALGFGWSLRYPFLWDLDEVERKQEASLIEIQALQSRLNHLDSEAYRFEIIENYHNNTLGNVEVALSCKVGFNYLEMQLPPELKTNLERFHYPPRVDNYLGCSARYRGE